ncbi:hypothetical protein LTR84_000853 [Exophiala bonariae]|uniref:PLD phosphodiesterase domain-containing protein n=1 Tax=Exophiala bonariae TaxID=1690606 RepID=A0AAV9NVF7_9EURO|nr:hypothetical protein LTR84_000853 [Exophiala bonariae]
MAEPGMGQTNHRASDSLEGRLLPDLDPSTLSVSTPLSLVVGTGFSVYKNSIIPAIKAAQKEVILVTCFWAKSETLTLINDALRHLSEKASASFSKISYGQNYPPATWSKLGLPQQDELPGLNITIKRKFFWPLGIIHSKYVIVDREIAVFPSCNVSWERWFEVAVSVCGPAVEDLLSFHMDFWDRGRPFPSMQSSPQQLNIGALVHQGPAVAVFSHLHVDTTLLPSPHTPSYLPNHLHPRSMLGNLPCFPGIPHSFPSTPLLSKTHHLLFTAKSSIIMLTPNLTEPVVINDLVQAMERGVDVHIWTNRKLMTMEQIVTAGTTTPRCVRNLAQRTRGYRGSLTTQFFDDVLGAQRVQEHAKELTPIKLHSKVTIVDGAKILLGSGNMDAASWKTSQELGIFFESKDLVDEFKKLWNYGPLDR